MAVVFAAFLPKIVCSSYSFLKIKRIIFPKTNKHCITRLAINYSYHTSEISFLQVPLREQKK